MSTPGQTQTALADPSPRDEKLQQLTQRFWAAMQEVAPHEVPRLEDLDDREAKALAAATDAMVSAVAVLLSRRSAAVPRPDRKSVV